MKHSWLVPMVLLISPSESPAQGPSQFAISDIQAKLYYSNSGRFSANIVNNPKIALRNVIIGEGGAAGPSESTLIEIRVSGTPQSSSENMKLHVLARTPDKVLLDRKARLGLINTNGNYYAAFLLSDTGCKPIDVMAEVIGPGAGPPARIAIPFQCGE